MKQIIFGVAVLSGLLISSCGNEYALEDYFELQQLPGYVAFKTDGRDAVLPPISTTEDGGVVSVAVENPTGSTSDITVNYSFSGTAEWGVDYMVEGTSASGGSLVITENSKDVTQYNFTNIDVMMLADSTSDGEKTLMITLDNAQNTDGDVSVGRGGTDYLKTAEIVIADIDE